MSGYLPLGDSAFRDWLLNFQAYAAANTVALGLAVDDLSPLSGAIEAFVTALDAHTSATTAAATAQSDKGSTKRSAVAKVRSLVRKIQGNPLLTDGQREAMRINVPAARAPVPVPASRPVGIVDVSLRLTHRVSFVDEATPLTRAKPPGVYACEVWRKVGGPAPVDDSELTFAGAATRSPLALEYDGADAGKTVYYWLRWIDTRLRPGPWSGMVSATIVA